MNKNEELESLTPETTMEGELKKRSQKRLFRIFIIIDIVLVAYIVYALAMLFTNL